MSALTEIDPKKVQLLIFSANLIEKAKERPNPDNRISYHVVDATDESQLLALGEHKFDSALCNMALFDMANIETLFQMLPKLLKPNGVFVFSITHPCFNNSSSTHLVEEWDDGAIHTRYAVKISRYMTPYQSEGLALRNQPKPQMYFERPIQYYMSLGFQNGFILDGFEERAFPPEHPQVVNVRFEGTLLPYDLMQQVKAILNRELIRPIAYVLIIKDQARNPGVLEGGDLGEEQSVEIYALFGYLMGLVVDSPGTSGAIPEKQSEGNTLGISERNLQKMAEELPPDRSILIFVLEHIWARQLREALTALGGTFISSGLITPESLITWGGGLAGGGNIRDRESGGGY